MRVLAIDLDGTLLTYTEPPYFGKLLPGMAEELKKLKNAGWVITMWTCRVDSEELRLHLNLLNIPYDYINQNPFGPEECSDKIYADVYLDDHALNFNGDTNGLFDKIVNFKPWHEK